MRGSETVSWIRWFLVLCLVVQGGAAIGADESLSAMPASEMEALQGVYREYQQAIAGLFSSIERAAGANPDFGPGVTGLLRVIIMDAGTPPGRKEASRHRTEDPSDYSLMQEMCEFASVAQVTGRHLSDPNLARQFRAVLLLKYRMFHGWDREPREKFMDRLAEEGRAVFDPNDSDDERLWLNIRHYELQAAQKAVETRRQLNEIRGVPVWMMEYVGYNGFTYWMHTPFEYWLGMEMSDEVLEAAKRLDRACDKLSDTHRSWRRVEHLLDGRIDPEQQEVIDAAARQVDAIAASIHRMFPTARGYFDTPAGKDFDPRKAGYAARELTSIILAAGEIRPDRKFREQYRQKRFVTPDRRR